MSTIDEVKSRIDIVDLVSEAGVKLRKAGFADCVDTEEMFVRLIRRYQDLRWLPPRD